jgi:hypothetical protein
VNPIASGVQAVGTGVVFFPGSGGTTGFTQVADPSISLITSSGNLNALSSMRAILNSSGQVAYENPLPGQLGSLGIGTMTGPRIFDIDVNLIKRFRIKERFVAQIGATAQNFTNTENFAAPATNIDLATFGHITATAAGFGPRILVAQLRLNF